MIEKGEGKTNKEEAGEGGGEGALHRSLTYMGIMEIKILCCVKEILNLIALQPLISLIAKRASGIRMSAT